MDSNDEARQLFDRLSNWGRWGDADQLGSLNLITPDVVIGGIAAASIGETVSLGRTVTPVHSAEDVSTPMHFIIASGEAAPERGQGFSADWYGIACHGHTITHVDSLGHIFWDGRMYNGRPAARVDQLTGASEGSVEAASAGIVTRGVLLDLPKALGLAYLPRDVSIRPDDLERAEAVAGVRVRSGDALLIRFGRGRRSRCTRAAST